MSPYILLLSNFYLLELFCEHGLELLADKTPLTRKWLEDMRDVYTFLEREFPPLLARFEEEKKKKREASTAGSQR